MPSFPIFLLLLLIFAGCDGAPSKPNHPVGRWEYLGDLPDGSRGIVRIEILPGPFVKYLGFREHMEPLASAHAEKLANDLERRWFLNPEMLMQFQEPWFKGYGGETDGVDFFRYDAEKNTLTSAREDSLDKTFQSVEEFTPFEFPVRISQ